MMIEAILDACNDRFQMHNCSQCRSKCTYAKYCPGTCGRCLDYIHTPQHAPNGAPLRKYDCAHMADFYTCKYACRYTSEIVYAVERMRDLCQINNLRVLSFGCGPCTDLFAIDYLHEQDILKYSSLEYRGIDYSKDVWDHIHSDIAKFERKNCKIEFLYNDVCEVIKKIACDSWVPNLIVFQYVFSDMKKHTDEEKINSFIDDFASYYNNAMEKNTYIILNDINLSIKYNGGREYFDELLQKLDNSTSKKGRFCDNNATSCYYPRGYNYGEDSDGEFLQNKNRFDYQRWDFYQPFKTCASAQMIIKKEM